MPRFWRNQVRDWVIGKRFGTALSKIFTSKERLNRDATRDIDADPELAHWLQDLDADRQP
jgi:hypothetical protein